MTGTAEVAGLDKGCARFSGTRPHQRADLARWQARVVRIAALDPTLGAVVTDVRLAALGDDEWGEIEAAFHEHAVLVFPAQFLSDDEQIAFARRFGELEVLFPGYDAVPITTVRPSGEVLAADDAVTQVIRGNQRCHTDSSYMPVSARASMLSGLVVPAAGGETEWADMRAGYDAVDPDTRAAIAERWSEE